MNCESLDLKAYVLEEIDSTARRSIDDHAVRCEPCREEIARLRLTRDMLGTLRDEEAPRRIAFVSDKVFEPRWWQTFLRPGFAAVGLLAAAIVVHALVWRPATSVPGVDTAAIEARIQDQVRQAVTASESRQAQKTAALLATERERYEFDHRADQATYAANLELLSKQLTRMYAAANRMEVSP